MLRGREDAASPEEMAHLHEPPSRARLMLALGLLASLMAVIPLGALTVPNGCAMTRMRPRYEDAEISDGYYSVLRYRERGSEHVEQAGAVLFLPGNGGDARQVRSLGHEVDALHGAAVYACDFRGEWSAFDGRIVMKQARFAKRVAKALAKRHGAVVVVGHSMGGVVGVLAARSTKAIKAVVALAAPVVGHPFAFERRLAALYPLTTKVPLAAIHGGPRDWQAPPWLVGGLEAAGLPGARHIKSVDHQCACWCNELIRHVAAAVAAPGDVALSSLKPRGEVAAGGTLSAARRHFPAGPAGASQLALVLVPRVPALLVAAALAPGAAVGFVVLASFIAEPDPSSKLLLAALLAALLYAVALPLSAVVTRKREVPRRRWAAVCLCGVHPALGLSYAAWTCSSTDAAPLGVAALAALPALAAAVTARRLWSPEPLAALVCLSLGMCRRRRPAVNVLGAAWAAYGAGAMRPALALEALGAVALLDLGAEFWARRVAPSVKFYSVTEIPRDKPPPAPSRDCS